MGVRLLFDGAASSTPVVLANRGIVRPTAAGGWELLCNEAYEATTLAPPTALAQDAGQRLLVANLDRVMRSTDYGCELLDASPVDGRRLTAALAPQGSSPVLYVATGSNETGNALYRSDDFGDSWQTVFSNADGQWFTSLQRAPSDAARLYAALTLADYEQEQLSYAIGVSSDGGASWSFVDSPGPRQIVAVHPTEPDMVFAQEQLASTAEYALLRSTDSGTTFNQVALSPTEFTSLTLGPGGTELWLGGGLGRGLLASSDAGASFQQIEDDDIAAVRSLQRHAGRLWMCANRSPNVEGCWSQPETGGPWELLLTFDQVTAPVACPGTTACETPWNDWAYELLGVPLPEADAGVAPAGDGGLDGGGRDGSVTPTPDAAPDGSQDAPSAPRPETSDASGGGCRASPAATSLAGDSFWLALIGLVGVMLRRRRSPRRLHPGRTPEA